MLYSRLTCRKSLLHVRLKDKKESLSEAELREATDWHLKLEQGFAVVQVRREYALPPPEGEMWSILHPCKLEFISQTVQNCPSHFKVEGWTILDFLERIQFGDGAEDVANLFENRTQRYCKLFFFPCSSKKEKENEREREIGR